MSILAQNHTDEVALLDCIQKFFAKHHVGKLLKQCNGTKEKGVDSIKAGKVYSADEVDAALAKEFGI